MGGDDIEQTTAVMGGADWERWTTRLADRDLLADGFTTAALSHIGSPLTAAVCSGRGPSPRPANSPICRAP